MIYDENIYIYIQYILNHVGLCFFQKTTPRNDASPLFLTPGTLSRPLLHPRKAHRQQGHPLRQACDLAAVMFAPAKLDGSHHPG